ncbi:MAG: hypothetical protein NVS3B20_08300 [Polyangiales bacterium]
MGDGVTDDTEAIRDAFDFLRNAFQAAPNPNPLGKYPDSSFVIFFPNGTYRVRDTLYYRGPKIHSQMDPDDQKVNWYELCRIRVLGESREKTVIRLDDGAVGYDNPQRPKIVLAYQNADTARNIWPATNVLENITIDVGAKNPGAVGVWFQGGNATSANNVLIQSKDCSGRYGFWVKVGATQGYHHDVTVRGFDYGIVQSSNIVVDNGFEHITLRDQRVAAVLVTGGGMSLRAIDSDQTKTAAQAVRIEEAGGQVVMVESSLRGNSEPHSTLAAVEMTRASGQSLFAREVSTTGYAAAIVKAGKVQVGAQGTGGDVDEYVSYEVTKLVPTQPSRSMKLAVEDPPEVPWFDPQSEWANVDNFGAVGDGKTDDSEAIQRAFFASKPVVYFPKARYAIERPITVPATVRRVDAMFSSTQASLVVAEASAMPLLVQRTSGGSVTLRAARDVILRMGSGAFSNQQTAPTKLFVENMMSLGNHELFDPGGQRTWARSLNQEIVEGDADIVVAGGTLWLFGFKTQHKTVSAIHALDGARVEVLGGMVNVSSEAPLKPVPPLLINDKSQVSFIGFTDGGARAFFNTVVAETHGSSLKGILTQERFPSRSEAIEDFDFVIPLYVGAE